MSFLNQLFGNTQQRDEYQDFVKRYDQGEPWDGISDQEAVSRYQQVTRQLPQEDYMRAAQEAFARMTPQQRQQFAQHLQRQARQQGASIQDLNQDGIDDRLQDPGELARVTSRLQQQQPGMLEQLLGGGGGTRGGGGSNMGEALNNPIAKAALAGIAAMAAQRFLGGGNR